VQKRQWKRSLDKQISNIFHFKNTFVFSFFQYTRADPFLSLSSVFSNSSSPNGSLIRTALLEITFTRALHLTEWIDAERAIEDLAPLDELEAAFLRMQVAIENPVIHHRHTCI
jgi:hypothetical protein